MPRPVKKKRRAEEKKGRGSVTGCNMKSGGDGENMRMISTSEGVKESNE